MFPEFPVRIPRILKFLFTGIRFTGPASEKVLYLTFDDGPRPEFCPWILDCLAAFDAKATFFLVGENVSQHPELADNIFRNGHSIGNHTFNHLNGFKTNLSDYLENAGMCGDVLKSRLSPDAAPMFRPPYGKIRPSQVRELRKLGYEIILWDVLSKDYEAGLSPEKLYQNVVRYSRPGSILVFHDNRKAEQKLRTALPLILSELKKQGYRFDALRFPAKKRLPE
jgi:peptidoglycan/xylan/chitin deacetylase (PgdA/CDA1 family)